jgi:hypothetical protein
MAKAASDTQIAAINGVHNLLNMRSNLVEYLFRALKQVGASKAPPRPERIALI